MMGKNRDPLHIFLQSLSGRQGAIPPFALELVLVDGMFYYVHSIAEAVEDSISIAVRIWDVRRLADDEIDALRRDVAALDDPARLNDPKTLHPALDWGVLRIDIDQISYCVEWHHPLWPVEGRKSLRSRLH